ncbi:MAG: hypothetical protein ACE5HZ_06015 [Fidelibacterota bacterium]
MRKDLDIPEHPKAIPITPFTFRLTEEDIRRYWDQIIRFPVEEEGDILRRLPGKLRSLMRVKTFSSFMLDLVNDVELLYQAIAGNQVRSSLARRMILFALNYFIEIEDEIPDQIDILGYVDDSVVVRWVVNEVLEEYPEILETRKEEGA